MIKFTSRYGAKLDEQTNLVSIMDNDHPLFTLSKADIEAMGDLFGGSITPDPFDPITQWEIENPELFEQAANKMCCLHVESKEFFYADDYEAVKQLAFEKFGKDGVEEKCCFFQGPKGPYKVHSTEH